MGALEHGDRRLAQAPRVQNVLLLTGWTGDFAGIPRTPGGQDRDPAMVAVARAIADSRHALRADGVKILLVQGEVRLAELAGLVAVLSRRAARGTTYYRSLVGDDRGSLEYTATGAAEEVARPQVSGIELPLAVGAGNQKVHEVRK